MQNRQFRKLRLAHGGFTRGKGEDIKARMQMLQVCGLNVLGKSYEQDADPARILFSSSRVSVPEANDEERRDENGRVVHDGIYFYLDYRISR